jgi:alkanesulfonate monooxygenase SsuD/methylene tetrahydromethanopterin reductase-like flavin-dependent oxidoreductase (luciferase family)
VLAANPTTTIDHISGGRAGLNLVMGWNAGEIAMFHPRMLDHEERYAYGAEWLDLVTRLWEHGDEPFDFAGTYFHVPGAESKPAPVQRPRPVLINAGLSPTGRAFATRYCDFVFTTWGESWDDAERNVGEIRAAAHEHGREVGVVTIAHVVCRDSDREARRAADEILEHGDRQAVINLSRSIPDPVLRNLMQTSREVQDANILSGGFSIVGTPERVVDAFLRFSEIGVDVVVMVFHDYNEELKFFARRVLPLLQESGLRH